MEYLVTSREMAEYDAATIEKIGIPALVLMERAAWAVCEEVVSHVKDQKRIASEYDSSERQYGVLIMAGCGNNGADGLALARMLSEYKEKGSRKPLFQVEVVICGNREKATEQWKNQYEILKNFPVKVGSKTGTGEYDEMSPVYDIMIDALFGVGLSREIAGEYKKLIQWFNKASGWKAAVDVPSGIHSDDGRIMGCAVKVDLTVCFAFGKRGIYFYPGCEYTGRVVVKNIGISELSFGETKPGMFRYTENIIRLLPKRSADGNKGTFGKVLLAAGNRNMAGAAVFSAGACLKAGTGMVKVLTRECNRVILQSTVPDALLATEIPWEVIDNGEEDDISTETRQQDKAKFYAWPDVLAIGPGLGIDKWAYKLVHSFLAESSLPLVMDADALNLLVSHCELMQLVKEQGAAGRAIILTPHVGELARLCDINITQVKDDPVNIAMGLAEKLNCVVVSKDARTLICESGRTVCMNITGNSGMAVAGSGDVLTGVIAGLLAQGMTGFEAASVGVYLHGLAGDKAADQKGQRAMTARDLVQGVGEITAKEE